MGRMDGGRIILDKSEGHQCNINLSNAIVEDEGLWYFHIIYGTNLKRKLYFHKVRVNVKPEVAKQNASSALLIIGVVCALALIVAVVVIAKRKSKNNIEDKEVPV